MNLILASKSPYRKALLEQAGFTFLVERSPFDEERFKKDHPDLSPKDLCLRLAEGKAYALESLRPNDFILGSDQLIELDDQILGQPGNHKKASEQLELLSGRTHQLHTSLALLAPNKKIYTTVRTTSVKMRTLSHEDIEAYLKRDEPFDCAGSYKMERAGLMLAESVDGGDPSAIQGLSLIDLATALRHFGRNPTEFWKDKP